MGSTHERGRRGEQLASTYLTENGYRILARNFRSGGGEVDIICERGEVLVFVEVKSWRTLQPADLEWSIDRRKQMRLVRAARGYLAGHPSARQNAVRFDVVFVEPASGRVHQFEGAFETPWPE